VKILGLGLQLNEISKLKRNWNYVKTPDESDQNHTLNETLKFNSNGNNNR